MSDELILAEQRLRDANDELVDARRQRRSELQAIEAHHRPIIQRAEAACAEAREARDRAKSNAVPDHEWAGKRVERDVIECNKWSGRETGRHQIYGVVETYRVGTPGSYPGHTFAIGQGVVRLCLKNGKPGSRLEPLDSYKGKWRLAEEASA